MGKCSSSSLLELSTLARKETMATTYKDALTAAATAREQQLLKAANIKNSIRDLEG